MEPPMETENHVNWMAWAIVATVIGTMTCWLVNLVLGILAIIQANNANNAYAMGQTERGDAANKNAKTLTIISLVLSGLIIIGLIAYFILLFFFGFTEAIFAPSYSYY